MIIDAYEIYGHDPTDKLDFLVHYQIEMMKIKRARDQVSQLRNLLSPLDM